MKNSLIIGQHPVLLMDFSTRNLTTKKPIHFHHPVINDGNDGATMKNPVIIGQNPVFVDGCPLCS